MWYTLFMKQMENITSSLSVRILHGHWIRHDSNWTETKTKEYYTLWSLVSGTVRITIGNKTFLAHEGDAVLFYPGCRYNACAENGECQFIFIFFTLEMGNGFDLFEEDMIEGIFSGTEAQQASAAFQAQFRHLTVSGCLSLKMYSAFLNYLCLVIDGLQHSGAQLFPPHTQVTEAPAIRQALDYIGSNYLSNPSVKQLASLVNLSEKRFIMNFKNTVGLSPGQYINQLRMRKAVELIGNTDKKVSEIAQILGYADQYAFSKAFKRSFGESPANFRNSVVL